MKTIKLLVYLFILMAGYFVSSCTKMDNYKKYIQGGPIRYTGKVDSIIVHPGYKRIKLTMILGSDPSVTGAKVYWSNNTDSANITRKPGQDTLNVFIDSLQERTYDFSVYTYDDKGHTSVVSYASGAAYGDGYNASIINRSITSFNQSPEGGSMIFTWGTANQGGIGTILIYSDSLGNKQQIIVPPTEMQTELSGYKPNSKLLYKTLYLPDSTAIDTLSIDYSSVELPVFERQLDKAGFSVYPLPTDIQDGGYGWHLKYLWDGNYGTPGWATSVGMPQWYTIDLGVTAKLSRFKTWQAPDRLYKLQSVKKFEVWGSNDPNPDGSWNSWTKLMSCESIKPSGLPVGENTDGDVAYAKAGEEFIFPDTISAVRYIRIKVLETWGDENWSTMSELTFWTHDH